MDTLAWNYQKLFVVAVGNDGEAPSPYNRVQAPADLVNGLGVGRILLIMILLNESELATVVLVMEERDAR
ncbi:hypothetical protein P7H21_00800 [Paenibacillus larvae]|nr:hypothetical protein [Paenibacillus larvae]MDT2302875.1 hypothetical protein [Paenibacillus larvae]